MYYLCNVFLVYNLENKNKQKMQIGKFIFGMGNYKKAYCCKGLLNNCLLRQKL